MYVCIRGEVYARMLTKAESYTGYSESNPDKRHCQNLKATHMYFASAPSVVTSLLATCDKVRQETRPKCAL